MVDISVLPPQPRDDAPDSALERARRTAAAEVAGLRIGVLGPLTIEVDGHEADLRGRSLRLLVCRLVLERGGSVPDDVLLRDVWGAGTPIGSLHTAVARVRRALRPDRPAHANDPLLERTPGGYRLHLDHDAVDADRFVALVAEASARPAHAAPALQDALAAWRGPAYADAADAPFAAAEITRLRELRIEAEELLLAARAAQHDRAVVADLESFTLAHPTRERAWELLVVALCRQDRAAEALSALRSARRHLVESTGLGVGSRLETLQAAVLRREPTLFARPREDRAAAPLLPRSNVPAPLTTIVGRAAEVDEVERRLRSARLVTVTGPAGVGKTRVAIEAARRHVDADGPWFVELADLDDDRLVEAVRRTVGLSGSPRPDAPWAGLADRSALLVLDNGEHLVDTLAPLIAGLLAEAASLRVLVTSRVVLDTPGESVLHLRPLTTAPDGPAVALFRERALAAGREPEAEEDAGVVAAICERLDGLPLAIELAAARAGALSDEDLLRLLDDRFALLRRAHGGPGRHSTMLATIEWSYRRLSAEEREAFEALAVFAGGFTLPAAAAVLDRADTGRLLARLVAASMVQVVGGRPRRYRLLESLREYAGRSTAPQQRERFERRHLDWVLELAADADTALRGRLSSAATETLIDETANIRAALARAGWRDVLRIGGGFYWFWYREGLTTEGLDALAGALAAADASGEPLDDATCARAAMGIALLSYLQGDHARIGAALERAGAAADRSGNPRVQSQYLSTRAYFEAGARALQAAELHASASLRIAEAQGDTGGRAESLMVLGEVARCAGDAARAEQLLQQAADAADAAGYTWAAISAMWIGAKAALEQGRIDAARRLSAASATRAAQEGERTSWIVGLATTAHIDLVAGDGDRAATLAGAAAMFGSRIGFDPAAMDADLAAWGIELAEALDDPRLLAAYRGAADLTPEQVQAVLDGTSPPTGPPGTRPSRDRAPGARGPGTAGVD